MDWTLSSACTNITNIYHCEQTFLAFFLLYHCTLKGVITSVEINSLKSLFCQSLWDAARGGLTGAGRLKEVGSFTKLFLISVNDRFQHTKSHCSSAEIDRAVRLLCPQCLFYLLTHFFWAFLFIKPTRLVVNHVLRCDPFYAVYSQHFPVEAFNCRWCRSAVAQRLIKLRHRKKTNPLWRHTSGPSLLYGRSEVLIFRPEAAQSASAQPGLHTSSLTVSLREARAVLSAVACHRARAGLQRKAERRIPKSPS